LTTSATAPAPRVEFLAAGRAILRAADTNRDGKLSFAEFRRTGGE
jgi:hypothetical protein